MYLSHQSTDLLIVDISYFNTSILNETHKNYTDSLITRTSMKYIYIYTYFFVHIECVSRFLVFVLAWLLGKCPIVPLLLNYWHRCNLTTSIMPMNNSLRILSNRLLETARKSYHHNIKNTTKPPAYLMLYIVFDVTTLLLCSNTCQWLTEIMAWISNQTAIFIRYIYSPMP